MRKKEMIETLLEAYNCAIQAGDTQECAKQVQIWTGRVDLALAGANMSAACDTWKGAMSLTDFSVGDYEPGYAFVANAESLKAILLGILADIEQSEPSKELFSMDVFEGVERNYIQRLAIQADGCYKLGWYDACAVMIRRLVEQLIVDCFEQWGIASKIKKSSKDEYCGLDELINLFLSENVWHIPPLARQYLGDLKSLKKIGDSAAHGRTITSHTIIERFAKAIFFVLAALVDIAYFQK